MYFSSRKQKNTGSALIVDRMKILPQRKPNLALANLTVNAFHIPERKTLEEIFLVKHIFAGSDIKHR